MNSYRKGMMLSLGVISATVDLYAVVPTDRDRTTKLLCPEHKAPVKQFYRCSKENEEVTETVRGQATASGWIIAPLTPKPTAGSTKNLDLTPIATGVLTEKTFEGPSVYYLAPSSAASMQTWEVLVGILKKGKIALVTKSALGSTAREKLWRLDLFRGYLVLRELVYPEAIREAPAILHVKVDKAITTLVDQFVENLTADWDSLDVTDDNARRFDEWMAAGETIVVDTPAPSPESTSPVNLMAALQEAVTASKKKKAR